MKTMRLIAILLILLIPRPGTARAITSLVMMMWRTEDLTAWTAIIDDFNLGNPDIRVTLTAASPGNYAARLDDALNRPNPPDLFACQPFASLSLYQNGQTAALDDVAGIQQYGSFARLAWQTGEGSLYCLPIASTAYGFAYNADYFGVHGLVPPTTQDDFLTLLRTIQKNGDLPPLAIGLASGTPLTRLLYDNVGPAYWNGEIGRQRLVSGQVKYDSAPFAMPFETLASWRPYLYPNADLTTMADAQATFLNGQAAILPINSLAIPLLDKASFKVDVFHAPSVHATDSCWLETEPFLAIGLNVRSENFADARTLLDYLASARFATLYQWQLPGQYSFNAQTNVTPDAKSLSRRFTAFQNVCQPTLPSDTNIDDPTHGHPITATIGSLLSQVLRNEMKPGDAARQLAQTTSWYRP